MRARHIEASPDEDSHEYREDIIENRRGHDHISSHSSSEICREKKCAEESGTRHYIEDKAHEEYETYRSSKIRIKTHISHSRDDRRELDDLRKSNAAPLIMRPIQSCVFVIPLSITKLGRS
jgi:hypothetical protein